MIGQTLGRYRIDSLLGEGGMGKVYKAFDQTLGRSAAVKVLPSELVGDSDRLERFVREARTASNLNHPNIVTIYEVGEAADGEGRVHFIAMELVEGETLRQRLMRGRLELPRALESLAQVAEGVATAHEAGVVHRDLKPENIVIAKSGFAKILDFGLAKLRAASVASDDGATDVKTTPGTVVGTIAYMSPEQARGEDVDHRTDIFALGCILYESIAGSRPFRGESSVDTLHKIIYSDPVPLKEAVADVPSELQRIVRKCLAKDREHRYQSAKDLAIDLRDLKVEVESQPRGVAAAAASPKKRWPLVLAALAILLLLGGVLAAFLMRRRETPAPPAAEKPQMSIARLTSSGNVIGAAISPDGEYLAYAYSDAGQHSLWVRQIATGSALQLLPPGQHGFWGLTFSPDSRSIYYALKSRSDPSGGLYRVPILGGEPRRLLTAIDSHVHFSSDGKQILFVRNHAPKPGHTGLVVANADGSGERILLSKAPPQSITVFWGAPAWSPDGVSITFPLRDGARKSRLMQFDLATGRETPFSKDEWSDLGDITWLPDRSGVLVIGYSSPGRAQVWFAGSDGRRQITNDLFGYRIVSLSADAKQLASVAADVTSAIWRASLDGKVRPAKLSNGKYDGLRGIAAASDGTIYFTSVEATRWDVWALTPAGQRRQVTVGEWSSANVAVTPDQRFLLTTMVRNQDAVLVRMNRDGSEPKVLCPVVPVREGLISISFTPDGRSVVFDSSIDGVWRLWRIPIDGGTPVPIREGDSPSVSPDGSRVAYLHKGMIEVALLDGKGEVQRFEKASVTNSAMVRWSPDGKGILHNAGANDRMNVWYQPLDGSDPRKVTQFDDELIHHFDVTPDGKELIVVRGTLSRDAVLIENFQ